MKEKEFIDTCKDKLKIREIKFYDGSSKVTFYWSLNGEDYHTLGLEFTKEQAREIAKFILADDTYKIV